MTTQIQSPVPSAALIQQGARHLFRMSNGDLVALWINNTTSNGLQYAISQDAGSTWTAPASVSASLPTDLTASAFCQNGDTLYGAVGESGTNTVTPLAIPYTASTHVLGTVAVGSAIAGDAATGGLSADWDSTNGIFHVLKTPSTNSGSASLRLMAFNTSAGLLTSSIIAYNIAASSCSLNMISSIAFIVYANSPSSLNFAGYTYGGGVYSFRASTNTATGALSVVGQGVPNGGGNIVVPANVGGNIIAYNFSTVYFGPLSSSTVVSSVNLLGDAGQPSLMALSSGDLVLVYRSNAAQANGELYQVRRIGGVWQAATRMAGGASTGWQQPSLCTSVAVGAVTVPVLYVTGTGTLALQADSVALQTTPNVPTGLSPSGNAGVNPSSPGTFSFTYTNTTVTDAMSAYQAQLIRVSDSVVIFDSGQTAGTVSSGSVFSFTPAVTLVAGVAYKWQVKAWDQGGLASAYSTQALFTAASGPTATLTAPSGTVVAPAQVAAWSFSDPQGYAQQSYQVQLLAADNVTVLWDSGTEASASVRSVAIAYTLANGTIYHVQVRVTSATSGLTSAWSASTITTSFTVPDLPPSFTATPIADVKGQRILLAWDDYRTSGRDFGPGTSPYLANWLPVAHFESPESWSIVNNGLGSTAAVALGAGGSPIEGTNLLGLTATPIANPGSAPTLALAAGTSSFTAGQVVWVAFAWRTGVAAGGTTLVSPLASVTIASNGQQVNVTVPALPALAGSVDIYVSISSNSTTLKLAVNSVSVSAIAVGNFASGAVVPAANTTIAGQFGAHCTALPAALPFQFGDGASAVLLGDQLSVMFYCTDWSQVTAAGSVIFLVTTAGSFGWNFNQGNLISAMPTSVGSGWWEWRGVLSAALTAAILTATITGIEIDVTFTGATVAAVTLYADDMRLVRPPAAGQTARRYGSGTNILASTVSGGVATVTDTGQGWQAGLFATPAAPATPYVVQDSGGTYWSISANTPTTLTVAPLQGQTSFPVGTFTLYRPDFLETVPAGAVATSVTWRLFNAEAGETLSADKYTYGQIQNGGFSTGVAICQTLGLVTNVAAQVQEVGGGGFGTGPANSAWRGIVLRYVDANNFATAEFNMSTNVWRVRTCVAGTYTTQASGTFAGLVGQMQYARAILSFNSIAVQGSSDGTTWVAVDSVYTLTGALAAASGYLGLITLATAETRFDRFWARKDNLAWPSSTDPASYDVWRRNHDPLGQGDYTRIAAQVTDPPGLLFDTHVQPGQGYDYQLLVTGANTATVHTP